MQVEIGQSIQSAVRPHECIDTYYSGAHNSEIQCFPSTVENRFIFDVPSKSFGSSSTVTFNPAEGLTDIVLTVQLPAPNGSVTYEGLALSSGWGYQLIRQIGWRYAGSSLYYVQGEQHLVNVLFDCEDSVKKDQMLALGGQALASTADFADANARTAYVYIKLPHNSPSAQEKPLPFPTDTLTQPVQIVLELRDASAIFSQAPAPATVSPLPVGLSLAQMQFKQVHMDNAGDLIARREDLSTKALSIPLKYFPQSQFSTQLSATTNEQQVNLTGFRAGMLQGILMWAVRNTDLTTPAAKNPLAYAPLKDVRVTVNGLVYYDARNQASQIWNLVERKTSSSVNQTIVEWDAEAEAFVASPNVAYWVWVPFAQGLETLRDESKLNYGLSIMNSVVNLQVTLPDANAATLYAEYVYDCTMLASKGTAEYVF